MWPHLRIFQILPCGQNLKNRLLGSLPKSGTSDLVVTTCMMRLRASLTRSPPRFDFSANFIKPALRGALRSKASRPVGLVGISAAREFISPPPDAKKAQTGIAGQGPKPAWRRAQGLVTSPTPLTARFLPVPSSLRRQRIYASQTVRKPCG